MLGVLLGGGGEAAGVGAGQGDENHPLADELLQEGRCLLLKLRIIPDKI